MYCKEVTTIPEKWTDILMLSLDGCIQAASFKLVTPTRLVIKDSPLRSGAQFISSYYRCLKYSGGTAPQSAYSSPLTIRASQMPIYALVQMIHNSSAHTGRNNVQIYRVSQQRLRYGLCLPPAKMACIAAQLSLGFLPTPCPIGTITSITWSQNTRKPY